MKKIDYNELSTNVASILSDYIDDIDEEVIKTTNEVIKEAKEEIVRISPQDIGDYAEGWTISIKQKGKNFFSKAVHNKTSYRLTHLLEFGHATKNGDHIDAQPHVRPTEEKYKLKLANELERKLKR